MPAMKENDPLNGKEDGGDDDENNGDNTNNDYDGADNRSNNDYDRKLLQDRGWAWMTMLGCFLAHVITGGLERSDGVLFLKLTDRYGENAQVTAWPGALVATIMMIMGPVASAVSSRYSERTSVMVGAFLYSAGLILSGLAPDMASLIVCFGFVQGVGRGLTYAPGMVIVGTYFNRRRGLAFGAATAGVGVGTFLLPPLVQVLFETFTFPGAFLVLGGIALNFCLVAMLYRPFFVHARIAALGRTNKEEGKAKTKTKGKMVKKNEEEEEKFGRQCRWCWPGWRSTRVETDDGSGSGGSGGDGSGGGESDRPSPLRSPAVDADSAVSAAAVSPNGAALRVQRRGRGSSGEDDDVGEAEATNVREAGAGDDPAATTATATASAGLPAQAPQTGPPDCPCRLRHPPNPSRAAADPPHCPGGPSSHHQAESAADSQTHPRAAEPGKRSAQHSAHPTEPQNQTTTTTTIPETEPNVQAFRRTDPGSGPSELPDSSGGRTASQPEPKVQTFQRTNSGSAQSELPDSPGSTAEKAGDGEVTSHPDRGLTPTNSPRGQVQGFESLPSHEKHPSPDRSHRASSTGDPVRQPLLPPVASANDSAVLPSTQVDTSRVILSPETRTARGASGFAVRLASSCLKTCFPSKPSSCRSPAPGGRRRRKVFDWALLREPAFLLYCFSIGLFTLSLKSSLVFLPPLVKATGVSEIQAAYLLSISGVVDTAGRITVGWTLELKPIRRFRPMIFNGFIFAICAVLFLAPSMSNFAEFGVVFAMFGFFTGAYVSQKSVILMDMLGVDRLSSSFGLLCFFQGVGNLIGPPLSGVLKDTLGNYREVFFLGGGSLAAAGVLMIVSNNYAMRATRASQTTEVA